MVHVCSVVHVHILYIHTYVRMYVRKYVHTMYMVSNGGSVVHLHITGITITEVVSLPLWSIRMGLMHRRYVRALSISWA